MSAEETRARLVAAALEALRDEGIAGLSARTIARHGNVNQALIFYHFGSVEHLLLTVARSESERRSRLYAPALREVTSFSQLVAVARRLHEEELASSNVAALTQMLAGAVGSEDLARGIWDAFTPWTTLVGETIERLLADTPYAGVLPQQDLTLAVTSLFVGIELIAGLHPDATPASLFSTMESVAVLVDALVRAAPPIMPAT